MCLCGFLRRLGSGLLLRRMEEDCGTILRSDIRTLAILSRRIVEFPEMIDQLGVRNSRGVESDFDDLGVAGAIGADVAIGRILQGSTLVAGGRIDDPGNVAEIGFDAPEAPRA